MRSFEQTVGSALEGVERENRGAIFHIDPDHFIVHTREMQISEAEEVRREELLREVTSAHGHNPRVDGNLYFNDTQEGLTDAYKSEPTKTQSILTNAFDFLPIIGSAKMVMEGLKGRQYGTGKVLQGVHRMSHLISGGIFFALDVTGVGVIASEIGKSALKVGGRFFLRDAKNLLSQGVAKEEGGKLIASGEDRVRKQQNV